MYSLCLKKLSIRYLMSVQYQIHDSLYWFYYIFLVAVEDTSAFCSLYHFLNKMLVFNLKKVVIKINR